MNFIQNVNTVQVLVKTQFNAPSLRSFIAILVCLEHSFWIVQQGSNLNDGFTKAWKLYLETQRPLVDQEVDNYLRSKGGIDWFSMKHRPSEEVCVECRQIVLNNLLSRPKTST